MPVFNCFFACGTIIKSMFLSGMFSLAIKQYHKKNILFLLSFNSHSQRPSRSDFVLLELNLLLEHFTTIDRGYGPTISIKFKNRPCFSCDIKTDVTIQEVVGPFSGSGSDDDPYYNMYQHQTMDWSYYKDKTTFQKWYKINKTTCWWERSRTNLVIQAGSVNIKIDVTGKAKDTGLPVGPDAVFNNNLTPTWKTGNLVTNNVVTYAKSSWPYAAPLITGMFSQCVSDVYDTLGNYQATLTTQIKL